MKKWIIAVALVLTVSISIGFVYFFFLPKAPVPAYALFDVHAAFQEPSDNLLSGADQQISEITVDVFEGSAKIGTAPSSINMSVGTHRLHFGDYMQNVTTPSDIDVNVTPYGPNYLSVNYTAKWGKLVISTSERDDYLETTDSVNATIFVDGAIRGYGQVIIGGTELTQYRVSFAPIEGYTAPANQTILIHPGRVSRGSYTYVKVLTEDQQRYVWARYQAKNSRDEILDSTSTIVYDQFIQWVLDGRVRIPFEFIYIEGSNAYESWQPTNYRTQTFYIAQYAGPLLQDRIDALCNVSKALSSVGLDLSGTNNDISTSIHFMHDQNKGEYVILIKVEIVLHILTVEESQDFQMSAFDKNDTEKIQNLFPAVVPAGIAYHISGTWNEQYNVGQISNVYTKITGTTTPLNMIYPFQNFTSLKTGDAGGFYKAWSSYSVNSLWDFYMSNSIEQIRSIVGAGAMGTAMLDPRSFLENLLWERKISP